MKNEESNKDGKLKKISLIVGILVGITAITGFTLKDCVGTKKQTPVEGTDIQFRGIVKNKNNSAPIEGVKITIQGLSDIISPIYTDSEGNFNVSITVKNVESVKLSFTHKDFFDYELNQELTKINSNKIYEIRLEKSDTTSPPPQPKPTVDTLRVYANNNPISAFDGDIRISIQNIQDMPGLRIRGKISISSNEPVELEAVDKMHTQQIGSYNIQVTELQKGFAEFKITKNI